jgi:SAM-dependent methyltransferase
MIIPKSYFKQFQTKKYSSIGFLKRKLISNFIYKIENLIKNINPQTILELGCGEGFVSGWINNKYPQIKITGADINKNDLALLRHKFKNIETILLDLETIDNLNFDNRRFDSILCLETLEHLKNPELLLENLKKINSKNIIVSVPWEPWFQLSNLLRGNNLKHLGDDPEHIQHWTNKQMSNLLIKHFIVKKNITSFPWQIFLLENY